MFNEIALIDIICEYSASINNFAANWDKGIWNYFAYDLSILHNINKLEKNEKNFKNSLVPTLNYYPQMLLVAYYMHYSNEQKSLQYFWEKLEK